VGTGERYDAVVEADSPGAWELRAAPVDGNEPPLSASFDTERPSRRPPGPHLRAGGDSSTATCRRETRFRASTDDPTGPSTSRCRATRAAATEWYIDGQTYPDAEPLRVSSGEHVRIRMVNRSPVAHPMHLHGHFFQVGDAVKDTVRVPPHMGEVVIDFVADNPGDWLFHCHNIYHLEAGMARVLTYE